MSNNQAKAAEAGTLKGNVPFDKFKDDYKDNGYAATGQPVVDSVYWTYIGWWPAHIVSKTPAKDQAKSDFAKKPMGDGAYVVKEWKAGQEIVLEKSDKPFPLGDPKIKTIVWRFFGETKAVIAALQKGEIDAVTSVAGLTPSDSPDLDKIAAAGVYKQCVLSPSTPGSTSTSTSRSSPWMTSRCARRCTMPSTRRPSSTRLYYGKYSPAELPGAILQDQQPVLHRRLHQVHLRQGQGQGAAEGSRLGLQGAAVHQEGHRRRQGSHQEPGNHPDDHRPRRPPEAGPGHPGHVEGRQRRHQHPVPLWPWPVCQPARPAARSTAAPTTPPSTPGWAATIPGFWGLYNCAGIPTKENNYSGQNNPGWCNKDADKALNDAENNADIVVSPAKRKTAYAPFFKAWTTEVPVIPLFVNAVPIVARTGFKNYTCGPTNSAPCGWNAWQWEASEWFVDAY